MSLYEFERNLPGARASDRGGRRGSHYPRRTQNCGDEKQQAGIRNLAKHGQHLRGPNSLTEEDDSRANLLSGNRLIPHHLSLRSWNLKLKHKKFGDHFGGNVSAEVIPKGSTRFTRLKFFHYSRCTVDCIVPFCFAISI